MHTLVKWLLSKLGCSMGSKLFLDFPRFIQQGTTPFTAVLPSNAPTSDLEIGWIDKVTASNTSGVAVVVTVSNFAATTDYYVFDLASGETKEVGPFFTNSGLLVVSTASSIDITVTALGPT